jgi:ferrous iron transport protein A
MKPSLNRLSFLLPMQSSQPISLMPLCQLPAGTSGLVKELQGEGTFRQRVRELGFGESSHVTKVSGKSTIICQVNGTRIALSHGAAKQIWVDPSASRSDTRVR